MKQAKAVKMLSALAQETRVNIFKLLIGEQEGLAAGVIGEKLKVPPATLSFHLAQLFDANLINSTRKGRVIIYSAKYKSLKSLSLYLAEPLNLP